MNDHALGSQMVLGLFEAQLLEVRNLYCVWYWKPHTHASQLRGLLYGIAISARFAKDIDPSRLWYHYRSCWHPKLSQDTVRYIADLKLLPLETITMRSAAFESNVSL